MTGFKTYFRSHLKSNSRILIYLLVITLVLTLVVGINSGISKNWASMLKDYVTYYYSTIDVPIVFLCLLAYIAPVLEFSFFKKRINLNFAYSMPISRRAMGVAHFLSGAITVALPFTLSYILNFIMILTRGAEHYNLAPLVSHYFLCLILGLAMYSLMVFAFNEANTTGDGIWFMFLWTFVLFFASMVLGSVTSAWFPFPMASLPWGLIAELTIGFRRLVELTIYSGTEYFLHTSECTFWVVIWILIGIASAIWFTFSFGKRRMEKTEEISDSFFGYRVLIPYFAVTGIIGLGTFPMWVVFEILALIGYTIYRRGLRYKLSDILTLLALIILLVTI